MLNKIILASKSKVRKEILDKNKIPNDVKPSNVDEEPVKKSLIKLLFAILICLIFLLYGQNQRGRSFDLIQNIDRVVLLDASFKQIKNSSISELLIGNYL